MTKDERRAEIVRLTRITLDQTQPLPARTDAWNALRVLVPEEPDGPSQ